MGSPDKIGAVILFDGVCNLCNTSVQFIIKRDKASYFSFAALQSPYGQGLLSKFHLPTGEFNSILLVDHGRVFQRSRAALEIAKKLDGLWPLFYAFIIVPGFIRDWLYNIISSNRYRMFGRQDQCMIPSPELKSRFVD
ncbi:MAG: thiol-disulfide oxidoreductase DCC family protein [Cyclobacteriaceae bacterium]